MLRNALACLQAGPYDEISRISAVDSRSDKPIGGIPWWSGKSASPLALQMLPTAIQEDANWVQPDQGIPEREMRDAHLKITNYRPLTEIRAKMTIPDFRLADWMSP
jgi:hypothetical protein